MGRSQTEVSLDLERLTRLLSTSSLTVYEVMDLFDISRATSDRWLNTMNLVGEFDGKRVRWRTK